MAATIKDVARLTGLSLGTISKYINGGKVKQKNKELLDQAIRELDFKVNETARNLKTQKTMTVGILVPTVEKIFFMQFISGLGKQLSESGYSVLICDYDGDPMTEQQKLEFLINKKVDGIVIMPTGLDKHTFSCVVPEKKPVVLVGQTVDGLSCDFVCAECSELVYSTAAILLDRLRGNYENFPQSIGRDTDYK